LLGRDSESLDERMFIRILKDAHDNGVIDLRRRGDDFDVARAAEPESVAAQSTRAEEAATPVQAPVAPGPRIGMGPRGGSRTRGRLGAPPPELLTIGIVGEPPTIAAPPRHQPTAPVELPEPVAPSPAPRKGRKSAAAKKAPKAQAVASSDAAAEEQPASKAKSPRRGSTGRAKKAAKPA
jgi:hypothetical protein